MERQELGLSGFDPLTGDTLADKWGARVLTPSDLPVILPAFTLADAQTLEADRKFSGFLLCLPGREPLIVYHPYHPPARRQSTLFHELAHLILGHQTETIESLLTNNRNKQQEEEAAYLGGCLHLPRTALRWAAQRGLSRSRIMTHFGASEGMLKYRCNVTGSRFT